MEDFDIDLDDYEYQQMQVEWTEDMGAFDDPDYDGPEREQGDYVAPWDAEDTVDERVGILPASAPDFSDGVEPEPEIDLEGMVPTNYLGINNPWEVCADHLIYYEPARFIAEQRKHEERYHGNIGWERYRHRRIKRERWWRDPDRSRMIQRQKNLKHYYSVDEDIRKERERNRKAAYRKRKKAERKAAKQLQFKLEQEQQS